MLVKSKHSSIKEVMQKDLLTIYPNQTVFDASVLMAYETVGALLVVKEDRTLVGIITDRDIVIKCNAVGKDVHKTKVFECMTTNPIKVVPSTSLADAAILMGEYGIRRLPVVENDKLVGLLSLSDIAKVSDECPNKKCPDETCILIDIAKELQKTSHLEQRCCAKTMRYPENLWG